MPNNTHCGFKTGQFFLVFYFFCGQSTIFSYPFSYEFLSEFRHSKIHFDIYCWCSNFCLALANIWTTEDWTLSHSMWSIHAVHLKGSESEAFPTNMTFGPENWHSVWPSAYFLKIIRTGEREWVTQISGQLVCWTMYWLIAPFRPARSEELKCRTDTLVNFGTGFCVCTSIKPLVSIRSGHHDSYWCF